ncbi:MAG TPA: TerC family protein [Deltaproteobacteria bacterium]|nr:TerC family protein [Deltaproteobacteria bacterium]HOM28505.1 TerC family protein [Deltaproteobacteria bacterium]HPP80973.1 TerC family protein [Deltaproteobacteria bacterium]
MDAVLSLETLASLVTLASIEIVLGVDNIVFLSIMVEKLPAQRRKSARVFGLGLAMVTRILLLFFLSAMMRLTRPLFSLAGHAFSARDLILLGGGIFLLAKATFEIHENLEGASPHAEPKGAGAGFAAVVLQIAVLDIVFSLDSVITAIGLARELWIMVAAIVIAVLFMMFLSGAVILFVERHPTIKMLALSFLLLIGVALVADGLSVHIPRGYIYFAMAFSVFVEVLNLKLMKKKAPEPVRLRRLEGVSVDEDTP